MGRLERQRIPAALGIAPVRFLEAARRPHHAVLEPRALAVPDIVERRQHVARQLRRLLEHRVDQIGARLLAAGQERDLRQPGELVEGEAHIGEGR